MVNNLRYAQCFLVPYCCCNSSPLVSLYPHMAEIHTGHLEIPQLMTTKPSLRGNGGKAVILRQNERLPEPRRVAYILQQVSEPHPTLEAAAQAFLRNLEGLNRSPATLS